MAWRVARGITALTGVAFAVLGLALFLAPASVAPVFAWKVSPFVTMTMGGWCLGNAWLALVTVRRWAPRLVYSSLLYLGLFGLLELAVLVAFRDRLVLAHPIAWLYVAALVLALLGGLAALAGWMTDRPATPASWGRSVGRARRVGVVAFVVFVGFLASYGLVAGERSSGTNGSIFPEPLTLFTLRAFAAFYLSLALGSAPLLFERSREVLLHHALASYGLVVAITLAAVAYAGAFDLVGRPGGLLYWAAYLVVGALIAVLLRIDGIGQPPRVGIDRVAIQPAPDAA